MMSDEKERLDAAGQGIDEAMSKLTAQLDADKLHVTDLAKTLGAFRKQLIMEGFDSELADSMADRLFEAYIKDEKTVKDEGDAEDDDS